MKVMVYRNLHRNTWSIKNHATRLIVGYSNTVYLTNVNFRVSEAGRQRVLRTQQKNVHAFVVGVLGDETEISLSSEYTQVKYNPYKYETFVDENENPVHFASEVLMINGKVYAKVA